MLEKLNHFLIKKIHVKFILCKKLIVYNIK